MEALRFVATADLLRLLCDARLTPAVLADLLRQATPELAERLQALLYPRRLAAVRDWREAPPDRPGAACVWLSGQLAAWLAEGRFAGDEAEGGGKPLAPFDVRLASPDAVAGYWFGLAQEQCAHGPGVWLAAQTAVQDPFSRTLLDGYWAFLDDDAAFEGLAQAAAQALLAEEDARLQWIAQAALALAQGKAVLASLPLSAAEQAAAEQTLAAWESRALERQALHLPVFADRATVAGAFAYWDRLAGQQGRLALDDFCAPGPYDVPHRIDDYTRQALALLIDSWDTRLLQRVLDSRRQALLHGLRTKTRMLEQYFWGLRHDILHPRGLAMLMNAPRDVPGGACSAGTADDAQQSGDSAEPAEAETPPADTPLIPALACPPHWPEDAGAAPALAAFAAAVDWAAGRLPAETAWSQSHLLGTAYPPVAARWLRHWPEDSLVEALPRVQQAAGRQGLAHLAQGLRCLALQTDTAPGFDLDACLHAVARRYPGTAAALRRWMAWEFHDLQFLPADVLAQALASCPRSHLAEALAWASPWVRQRMQQAFPDLPVAHGVSRFLSRLRQAQLMPWIALAGDPLRTVLPLPQARALPDGEPDLPTGHHPIGAAPEPPPFSREPDAAQALWMAVHLLGLHRSEPEAAYGLWARLPAAARPRLIGYLLQTLVAQPDNALALALRELAQSDKASPQAVIERLADFVCGLPADQARMLQTAVQAEYPAAWTALAPDLAGAFLTTSQLEQLSDQAMQRWLRECATEALVGLLPHCRPDFAERVYANLSRRCAEMLREDARQAGPLDRRKLQESLRQALRALAASQAENAEEDGDEDSETMPARWTKALKQLMRF